MNAWTAVDAWLQTRDADTFIDDAVLGALPAHEADSLLEEFDIVPNRESRRTLFLLMDSALTNGR